MTERAHEIISVDASELNCQVWICARCEYLTPRKMSLAGEEDLKPAIMLTSHLDKRARRSGEPALYCNGPFRAAVHVFAVRMAQACNRQFRAD